MSDPRPSRCPAKCSEESDDDSEITPEEEQFMRQIYRNRWAVGQGPPPFQPTKSYWGLEDYLQDYPADGANVQSTNVAESVVEPEQSGKCSTTAPTDTDMSQSLAALCSQIGEAFRSSDSRNRCAGPNVTQNPKADKNGEKTCDPGFTSYSVNVSVNVPEKERKVTKTVIIPYPFSEVIKDSTFWKERDALCPRIEFNMKPDGTDKGRWKKQILSLEGPEFVCDRYGTVIEWMSMELGKVIPFVPVMTSSLRQKSETVYWLTNTKGNAHFIQYCTRIMEVAEELQVHIFVCDIGDADTRAECARFSFLDLSKVENQFRLVNKKGNVSGSMVDIPLESIRFAIVNLLHNQFATFGKLKL